LWSCSFLLHFFFKYTGFLALRFRSQRSSFHVTQRKFSCLLSQNFPKAYAQNDLWTWRILRRRFSVPRSGNAFLSLPSERTGRNIWHELKTMDGVILSFLIPTKHISGTNSKKVKVKITLVQTLRLCTGRTAHRGSRGIAIYSFMTTTLGGGKGSLSGPGRFLPPGKTRYQLYRRLGGPQGQSGHVRKI
jgi:hypothetical protein